MIEAPEAVRERVFRDIRIACTEDAVAGGNAVAAGVACVDSAAVRNTQDVVILVRRSDFDAIWQALESVGFVHHELMGIDCFIDGPDGSPRDAVHLLHAWEKLKPEYVTPSVDVTETESAEHYDVLSLLALVRMRLNSFRREDQVHLLDMLEIGFIDSTWLASLAPRHAGRLQQLIFDPDG